MMTDLKMMNLVLFCISSLYFCEGGLLKTEVNKRSPPFEGPCDVGGDAVCHYNGECKSLQTAPFFLCECKPGFKGQMCKEPEEPANPGHKPTTMPPFHTTAMGALPTTAPMRATKGMPTAPKQPSFCEQNADLACSRHGKCEDVTSGGGPPFRCVCDEGYTGFQCDVPTIDSPF